MGAGGSEAIRLIYRIISIFMSTMEKVNCMAG